MRFFGAPFISYSLIAILVIGFSVYRASTGDVAGHSRALRVNSIIPHSFYTPLIDFVSRARSFSRSHGTARVSLHMSLTSWLPS